MINKQALLEWLKYDPDGDGNISKSQLRNEIHSGRFNAPSDDRLRAALEQIKYMPSTPPMIRAVADKAISTTTEPTGAKRVMEFPIEPGSIVNYSDFQFGNLNNAKLDHIKVHSFGNYAVLEHEGEFYTVPYERIELASSITTPGINAPEKEDNTP